MRPAFGDTLLNGARDRIEAPRSWTEPVSSATDDGTGDLLLFQPGAMVVGVIVAGKRTCEHMVDCALFALMRFERWIEPVQQRSGIGFQTSPHQTGTKV